MSQKEKEKEEGAAVGLADEKSKKKYLNLTKAIDEAIKSFSDKLNGDTDKKYGDILTELGAKISNVRKEINADADVTLGKSINPTVKKSIPEPELVSREMSIVDVNKFITEHNEDAIFVVTGGSFNPPHNGHIGMFQKAYDALKDKGKKVYGVMVPALDSWIDGKVNAGKLDASQKINIKSRVDLCTLSCDSYNWTDSTNFNASNMIVVNEGDNNPATSILRTADGKYRDNAYYLCGSDYYAAHGSDAYKFICVLRAGVTLSGQTQKQIHFVEAPITDSPTTSFNVKDTDIIIEDDGGDNDASSTMLRDLLTKINSVRVEGDALGDTPKKDELLKLISIPVLRRLLDLRYILTNTENNKKVLRIMDIDLDPPDAKSSNDTDSKLRGKDGVISNGPRSLANMGQTCYMNAALQLIYSMTELKDSTSIPELDAYLKQMDVGVVSSNRKLAENLYARAKAHGFVPTRTFNQQEDSSELLVALLGIDTFNKTLVNFTTIDSVHTTTTPDPNKAACRTQTGVDTHAQYANMPDSIKNDIIYIPDTSQLLQIYNLPIKTSDSEFNSMDLQIKTEFKDKDVTTFLKSPPCSNIPKETISTQSVIIPGATQRYFIVSLNRFDAGAKLMNLIKLTNAEVTLGTIKFKIKGCINHHGTTKDSGHYTYVEFKNGDPDMVYDDDNITPYKYYVSHVGGRTVDTEGYVLLFERDDVK